MATCRYFLVPQEESSTLHSFAYDASREILELIFNSNKNYSYTFENINSVTFLEMLEADSIGNFINTHIKRKGVPDVSAKFCRFVSSTGKACELDNGHAGSHRSHII